MPATRTRKEEVVTAEDLEAAADAELTADAPAKARKVKAVPKPNGKVKDVKETLGPVFMKLTPTQVAPKAFRSSLVPIGSITGWETVGDYPTEDFVEDIKLNGLEVPIVIRPLDVAVADGDEAQYEAVEGKRRLKTFHILNEQGVKGFDQIPAVINPRKGQRDPRLISIAANYKRGENVTGDSRTVKSLMDEGYTEKQIADASSADIAVIRALRDIITRLDPRLFAAVEAGNMGGWAARMAARLGDVGQGRLVKKYELTGKITPKDVEEARNFNVESAASTLPGGMAEHGGDLPYDEELDGSAGELREVSTATRETATEGPIKTGKLSTQDRIFNANRLFTMAKEQLKGIRNPPSFVAAALDAANDAIQLLGTGDDEAVLDISAAGIVVDDDEEVEGNEEGEEEGDEEPPF